MVKHLRTALKSAYKQWRIERCNKKIQAATRARAKAKRCALKAQAKRDALAK